MYDTIRTFGRIVDVNMNSLADKGVVIVTFSTRMAANKLTGKGKRTCDIGVITCMTPSNRRVEATCVPLENAYPVQNRKAKEVSSPKYRRGYYR